MKLSDFMTANDMTPKGLGDRLGVNPETVRTWLRGEAIPRREAMESLIEISGGQVQPNDFFATAGGSPSEGAAA